MLFLLACPQELEAKVLLLLTSQPIEQPSVASAASPAQLALPTALRAVLQPSLPVLLALPLIHCRFCCRRPIDRAFSVGYSQDDFYPTDALSAGCSPSDGSWSYVAFLALHD